MNLMQILLVSGALLAFMLYVMFLRSILRDRLIAFGLCALSLVAIIFPGLTTAIARVLGVGRGTDLVFYLFAMTTVFVFILIYSKLARIERAQTEIVRHIALQSASRPAVVTKSL